MKYIVLFALLVTSVCQSGSIFSYEPSIKNPYGSINPQAPQQVRDYEMLIGKHNCHSVSRNKDKSWAKPVDMIWIFKYIMNGTAIQDYSLKSDGKHSGSIRQYDSENQIWHISYYSTTVIPNATQLPMWTGAKKDDKLVYYRDNKAPNGTDGYFRLTFYDISQKGFKWIAEWTDKTETTIYPTWKIDCTTVE